MEYVFKHTQSQRLVVPFADRELELELGDPDARQRAQLDFTERLKTIPTDDMEPVIRSLAEIAQVVIPETPPEPYRPMTWEQLRSCERSGMSFGPHTVTHPILSQTSDARSEQEITTSWHRLREESERPVPIFCYPNGQEGDFGAREFATIDRLGLRGAVVGTAGYASGATLRDDGDGRFQVRRFSFPDSLEHTLQYASGLERVKQVIRREAA